MKRLSQILIYLLVISISMVSAESYEFSHRYNARAIGMANIFCAVADDSTAIFYNPAGLCQIQKNTFNSMYADIHGLGIARNFILSGAQKYNDDIGMAGAWVFERIDLEPEIWQQHRFFYGISYAILEKFYIGVTPKIIHINTDLENYRDIWGYAFDGGLFISSENWGINFFNNNEITLRIGTTFKNIYSIVKWNDDYNEKRFLNLIWWGTGVNYKNCLDFLFQVKSIKTQISSAAAGFAFFLFNILEINPDEKYRVNEVVLRCGMEYNKDVITQNAYSGGIGINVDNYSFDYAVSYQSDYFPSTHYFSINARK